MIWLRITILITLFILLLYVYYTRYLKSTPTETFTAETFTAGNNPEGGNKPEGTESTSENEDDLVCILAGSKGNKYCVRDHSKKKQAAHLIARVAGTCRAFVDRLISEYPQHPFCIQLHEKFDESKICETLPNSEYTAFTENKGEKISLCLTPQKDNDNGGLIDEHTLMFVAIHELTHVGTASIGHQDDFWDNFKFMLERAKEYGYHDPVDYKATPAKYCSTTIKDNPIYDWNGKRT